MNDEHRNAYYENLFNRMAELDSELQSLDEDQGGPGSEERFRLQTEINRLQREVDQLDQPDYPPDHPGHKRLLNAVFGEGE